MKASGTGIQIFGIIGKRIYAQSIVSTYFLPITFTCLYARDKKCIRKIFLDTIKLCIEHPDIDSLSTKLNKTLALRYIHDDAHFINDFVSKCPSGQYHSVKYRSLLG